MSRRFLAAGCLASMVLFTSVTLAQAPVPKQLLTARTAFIGNAGGESYGAESYFRRTVYDGGSDRAYNSFYNAVKEWGHYELVGATRDADIVLVIRFASPVVDHANTGSPDVSPNPIYDPQLRLAINDPITGLALWTITEHIEPGGDRAADNRHFDEAVDRLVTDLERLILAPEGTVIAENVIPPGAVRIERTKRRINHALIGGFLGSVAGGYLGSRTANHKCDDNFTILTPPRLPPFPIFQPQPPNPPPLPDLSCDIRRSQAEGRNTILGSLAGMVLGSAIGWILPATVSATRSPD